MSLRERVVDALFMAALEGTEEKPFTTTDRMLIAKLLALAVPAGVVTREMLEKGVIDVMMFFDDIKSDYPRADKELAELCEMGLLKGTLKEAAFDGPPAHDATARAERGYVPIGVIAEPVARRMFGISQASLKLAGALLPKSEDEAYHDKSEGGVLAAASGGATLRPAALDSAGDDSPRFADESAAGGRAVPPASPPHAPHPASFHAPAGAILSELEAEPDAAALFAGRKKKKAAAAAVEED